MTRSAYDPVGRPFGLVLSDDEDRRERGCKALVSKGFDVLAFLDAAARRHGSRRIRRRSRSSTTEPVADRTSWPISSKGAACGSCRSPDRAGGRSRGGAYFAAHRFSVNGSPAFVEPRAIEAIIVSPAISDEPGPLQIL